MTEPFRKGVTLEIADAMLVALQAATRKQARLEV